MPLSLTSGRGAVLASLLLCSACATQAPESPQPLFLSEQGTAPATAAALLSADQPSVTRGWLVRLNLAVLDNLRGQPSAWRPFVVDVGAAGSVQMTTMRLERPSPGMERWVAASSGGDRMLAIIEGGTLTALIEANGYHFTLYGTPTEGLYRLIELDRSRSVEGGDFFENPVAPGQATAAAPSDPLCDADHGTTGPPRLAARPTVMVLWTPAARYWLEARGRKVRSEIQLIMDTATTAMADRWFSVVPQLVHAQEIDRQEAGINPNADLYAMTESQIPGVALLREQQRADLVLLLGHYPDAATCGLAWVNDNAPAVPLANIARYGYGIANVDVAGPGFCDLPWSGVHALGHNFGMRHEQADTGKSNLTYNVAAVNRETGVRTLMATNGTCPACTRADRFSTPHEMVRGGSIGVAAGAAGATHNMEALCRIAPIVERFR
jgi:hypothetical protein